MYHFVADHPPVPVRLSFRAQIPGHVRQYLKQFQIEAIQFMHNFLAKGEFCVYNDESGLGKQAAIAVLLDAACGNKKSLIVVQNDDIYVNAWEFHFNVLTNCSVTVIKENKDSTNSPHNIYIAKWSTLRAIDDLSKYDFDFIILDNRGQMLNNSFCTSMLLKHYERKINILISSVDITSDLKLLHNVMKLGGRLDPRYSSFKIFEEKFKLPDAKELAFRKVDLEDYFLKRERLADYCKNFRLRRYCHQFEQQLPLVDADRYKINLDIWREKQTATNSESSSVEIASQNRQGERIRDTQELFEEYCRQRRKQQEKDKQKLQQQQQQLQQNREKELELENICNVDDEVAFINATPPPAIQLKSTNSRDTSDEAVVMSPLLLVSDSEDSNDVPQICNDPDDIVDLSTDEEPEANKDTTKKGSEIQKVTKKKIYKYRNEIERLKDDVATNLKFQNETTPKRRTRHNDETQCVFASKRRTNADTGRTTPKEATSNSSSTTNKKNSTNQSVEASRNKNQSNITANKETRKSSAKDATPENPKTTEPDKIKPTKVMEKEVTTKNTKPPDANKSTLSKPDPKDMKNEEKSTSRTSRSNRTTVKESEKTPTNATTVSPRARRVPAKQNTNTIDANKTTPTTPITDIVIKKEPGEHTPQNRRSHSKDSTTIQRIKRELDVEHVVLNKETRSMQRLTRFNKGCQNKNAIKNSLFNNEKPTKPKRGQQERHGNKSSNQKIIQSKNAKSKDKIVDTQAPIIAMTCSQDFEPIECAQRLSDVGLFENNTQKKSSQFLVPRTPVSTRNSLIPSSLISSNGFFTESEVTFVPPSKPAGNMSCAKTGKTEDVIILSGSDNDNSSSVNLSATSRRTRVLKPRRLQNSTDEASKVPTFSQLLAQHNTRTSAKSPDLFSNCSDLGQLTCSQKPVNADEPNAPFEGFKIFGSEVKQLQQHYALSKSQYMTTNGKKASRDRSCLDILENMFEPPNKKKTKTTNKETSTAVHSPSKKTTQKQKAQTPIVPQHPIEAIAEAKAQQDQKKKRSLAPPLNEDEIFEITNNGTFGSVMRLHSNGEISPVHQTQKSSKQHNKITKYFQGGLTQNLTGSQEDSGNNSEAGTPSKRQQQPSATQQQTQQLTSTQYANLKKSPKPKCSSTQATKLTKWFTKNTPTKQQIQTQVSISNPSPASKKSTATKRTVKRRRLDLTLVTDDSD